MKLLNTAKKITTAAALVAALLAGTADVYKRQARTRPSMSL